MNIHLEYIILQLRYYWKWLNDSQYATLSSYPEAILCMCPANERWRYNVTSSLIGWAHAQYDPWY